MSIETVLENYRKIAQVMNNDVTGQGMPMPKLESGLYKVSVASETKVDAAALNETITSFGVATGWLGYQSGNQHQTSLSEIALAEGYGALLNAELANTDNQALHIRYNGQGGWIVTHYDYSAGDEYIVDSVSYVSSFDDDKKLNYLRFWKADERALGVNPVFACFTGFGG